MPRQPKSPVFWPVAVVAPASPSRAPSSRRPPGTPCPTLQYAMPLVPPPGGLATAIRQGQQAETCVKQRPQIRPPEGKVGKHTRPRKTLCEISFFQQLHQHSPWCFVAISSNDETRSWSPPTYKNFACVDVTMQLWGDGSLGGSRHTPTTTNGSHRLSLQRTQLRFPSAKRPSRLISYANLAAVLGVVYLRGVVEGIIQDVCVQDTDVAVRPPVVIAELPVDLLKGFHALHHLTRGTQRIMGGEGQRCKSHALPGGQKKQSRFMCWQFQPSSSPDHKKRTRCARRCNTGFLRKQGASGMAQEAYRSNEPQTQPTIHPTKKTA